jgi:hypothetical protein
MILRKKKQIMRRLGRSLLLRVLLKTRILVSNTTKRCLHIARGLVNAAVPCKARLLTQSSSYEAHSYTRGAQGSEGAHLLTQSPSCEAHLLTQSPSCEAHLITQSPSCEAHLLTQSPSCEVVLFSQHPPARIIVDADLSCEAPFYTRGAHGSEGSLTSLGSWQRQPWSRKLSSPQAREGHYDVSKCEDQSVRTKV